MNISPITTSTNGFCALQKNQAKIPTEQYIYKTVSENPNDKIELTTKEKFLNICSTVKNACSKGFNFIKNNKKAIATSAVSLGKGLLVACTILGANQIISKLFKAKTEQFANKLAAIGGVTTAVADIIKNKDNFTKNKAA